MVRADVKFARSTRNTVCSLEAQSGSAAMFATEAGLTPTTVRSSVGTVGTPLSTVLVLTQVKFRIFVLAAARRHVTRRIVSVKLGRINLDAKNGLIMSNALARTTNGRRNPARG